MKAKNGPAFEVIHTGSILSCRVVPNADLTAMHVYFDVKANAEKPDVVIPVEGKSLIDIFCPSVEGTVILCILKSGEERYYDTRTGKLLVKEDLKARAGEIHFYQ